VGPGRREHAAALGRPSSLHPKLLLKERTEEKATSSQSAAELLASQVHHDILAGANTSLNLSDFFLRMFGTSLGATSVYTAFSVLTADPEIKDNGRTWTTFISYSVNVFSPFSI